MLATVGLRISEALHLRVDDIIFHKNYAELIIYGKGNKQRILKISKEYAEELVKFANGKEYLFQIRKIFLLLLGPWREDSKIML